MIAVLEYTDAAKMRSDYAARRARLYAPGPVEPEPAKVLPVYALPETPPQATPKQSELSVEEIVSRYNCVFDSTNVVESDYAKAIRIRREVAEELGVRVSEFTNDDRTEKVSHARQFAIWMVGKHTELNITRIGRLFNRDHSTAIHAIRSVNGRLGEDVRGYGDAAAKKQATLDWSRAKRFAGRAVEAVQS